MKSAIIKRSVTIAAHRTSVSLEDDFWNMLKEIADQRGTSVKELIASIEADRRVGTLSTALRLFVLTHLQDQISAFLRQRDQSDATPVMNR
jgi:predicted DNA-binding ribbon-helix-helix protein